VQALAAWTADAQRLTSRRSRDRGRGVGYIGEHGPSSPAFGVREYSELTGARNE
jgi:hypothetical protein